MKTRTRNVSYTILHSKTGNITIKTVSTFNRQGLSSSYFNITDDTIISKTVWADLYIFCCKLNKHII